MKAKKNCFLHCATVAKFDYCFLEVILVAIGCFSWNCGTCCDLAICCAVAHSSVSTAQKKVRELALTNDLCY